MQAESQRIRVLVVDDSAVMRKLVTGLLEKDADIEVVGTAIDGVFALSKVEQLRPDVVTLDIDMPRADGLSALRRIVSRFATPVVMLSALTGQNAALTLEALELGAVDFVGKPRGAAQLGEVAEELIEKVKAAARIRIQPVMAVTTATGSALRAIKLPDEENVRVLAVGASSGGPNALRQWLPKLPAHFPVPIVIVQHLPDSFTTMFARWMNETCQIEVKLAADGLPLLPGQALIAPGNTHLKIRRTSGGAIALLDDSAPVNGHRPSVDVLFRSVAEEYGRQSLALIMTGMGSDGAEGIGAIRQQGGHTIAQDEASCMIFGMPRAAITRGHINQVVPLADLAAYLMMMTRTTELQKRTSRNVSQSQ